MVPAQDVGVDGGTPPTAEPSPVVRTRDPLRPGTNVIKLFTFVIYKCSIRKDCFQNKSKFITEDKFTERVNITT